MNNFTRTITSFLSMTILITGLVISPVYAEETVADDGIHLLTREVHNNDKELNNITEFAYVDINNVNDLATALGTGSVTILSETELILTQNIDCSTAKQLCIKSGIYTIDFNGFTISKTFLMDVSGGDVTLKDSSVAQTGGIDSSNGYSGDLFFVRGGNLTFLSGQYKASVQTVDIYSGTCNLMGGVIRGSDKYYAAFYVGGGTLNMSGGSIESPWGVAMEGGAAIISGGNIISTYIGIEQHNFSVCTISGGRIATNYYALCVFDATLSVSGGEFIGKFGGLSCLETFPNREISLSGGTFSSNPANWGGGVVSSEFNMNKPESVATYISSGYMFLPSTIMEDKFHLEDGSNPDFLYSHTASTVTVVSSTSVEGFVNRLYTKALERSPDPTGFADWVSQLKTKNISGSQAAYGFFFSPEINNRSLPDTEFVKLLYNVFFDRNPDSTGFSYWLSALETRVSRKYVFAGFANSQEWKTLCGTYAIEPGSYSSDEARDQNIKVTMFVQNLYLLCLNRWADVPGLNEWTAALNSKQKDGAHVAYGFFFSPEFKNQNLSNENYVEILYQVLLGRASDSAGKADWVAQLKAGKDRLDVFRGFVHSKEFDAICASYGITRGTI